MVPSTFNFNLAVKFFVYMINYSRSATILSTISEKPAHSSLSTPVLLSRSDSSSQSTTSIVNESLDTSSLSRDGTLSMITTPWTTESWQSSNEEDFSWVQSEESLTPKTSTSYGDSTIFDAFSKTTLTIYGTQDNTGSQSVPIYPLNNKSNSGLSSTFSSWTLETFTSSSWLSDLSSELVKIEVNYPWSPYTEFSYTDTYPSSVVTNSRFSIPSNISANTKDIKLLTHLDATQEDYAVLVT